MRKFYLKTTNGLLSTKRENTPGILFSVNYNQAIDFIESLPPTAKNKPLEICFEKNGMEFTNISRILRDPEIVKSLPTSSVKFSLLTVTYKLTPPTCTKFFQF